MYDWESLRADFVSLQADEQRIVQQTAPRYWLTAHGTCYEAAICGKWRFTHIPSEHILTRFELAASRGGVAMGTPSEIAPRDFWLHSLFVYLREKNSDHLDQTRSDGGGVIERVIEASAMYCAHLAIAEINRSANAYPSSAQSEVAETDQVNEPASTRRAEIDSFLEKCNKRSSVRIFKRHIWQSVGHSRGRQFEYWQAGAESKTTSEDERNFGRILRMPPEAFVALLKSKKLISD